jgi:large subunit ribosomal protein L28
VKTCTSPSKIRFENYQKNNKKMSKICQITGKKSVVGNNVSHSLRRTKRRFDVNLFTKKFYYVEEDCWIVLKVSAAGLRIINRIGLDAALKQAVAKGHCEWKDIQVIG